VSSAFEELDRRATAMGELSLRRRLEPSLQIDVYEAMLGEEHLMSSLFTAAEIALARLGLAAVTGTELDVVVGGLGLGYTAQAVLEDPRVRSLRVVEALEAVIGWHERDLLPLSTSLVDDPRCHLVHGDFFAMVADGLPFGGGGPERVDAVLVDIDHTPQHVLHPSHAGFYAPAGLARLARRLEPGGVFALWSDDPPDDGYLSASRHAFARTDAHVVRFPNPHTGGEASNTVYVASGHHPDPRVA
jgi:spermidine synthase